MACLVHELWVDAEGLDLLCLAGPMGDEVRRLLKQPARLVRTLSAESHFDVMTKYYTLRGLGDYRTDHAWDFQPYPEEWLSVQQSGRRSATASGRRKVRTRRRR